MMTGFKKRFELFVRDGSKEHTLRNIRRGLRQVRGGDRLDCYANVRQKDMTLIGRWWCIRIQVAKFLHIGGGLFAMEIDGVMLSSDEADGFAWRDGFRWLERLGDPSTYTTERAGCFAMMMAYWQGEKVKFPFSKQLLHWKFTDRLPDELPKKPRRAAVRRKI